MATLEDALAELEGRLGETQRSAEGLVKALRRLRKAAAEGSLGEIGKGIEAVGQRAFEAAEAATELGGAWRFDAAGYLASGYIEELRAAAEAAGLRVIERDGRLYLFPLLLRLLPSEAAVRVGKRKEKRLRPKVLVGQLKALQQRPQTRAGDILKRLYDAYQALARAEWRKLESGPGPVLSVAELHGLLTLGPGADYPIEEFGRDLLILDRQPDLRTRDGAAFEFAGSSMGRERGVQRVVVYDEEGRERVYLGIRFMKAP